MDQNQPPNPGNVPHPSVGFGKIPNDAEGFRTVPHSSESFRKVPKISERNENHTLTVREVARVFEAAGVARTERSIINWCQMNSQGVARLDAYYDPNERKYFITPQSVELAIAEERAKAAKNAESSAPVGSVPQDVETRSEPPEPDRLKELEREVLDLKITNRGKDFFIDQLQKERASNVEQLMTFSRKVGELETRLLQLSAPTENSQSSEPIANLG